jgi:hypothetical protein
MKEIKKITHKKTKKFESFLSFALALGTFLQALPGDRGSWASGLGDLRYCIITTQ